MLRSIGNLLIACFPLMLTTTANAAPQRSINGTLLPERSAPVGWSDSISLLVRLPRAVSKKSLQEALPTECRLVSFTQERAVLVSAPNKFCSPEKLGTKLKQAKVLVFVGSYRAASKELDVSDAAPGAELACSQGKITDSIKQINDCLPRNECNENLKSMNWGQRAMGLDLATKWLASNGINAKTQKVAVIDTGADVNTLLKLNPNSSVKAESILEDSPAGDDKVFHGTGVSGLILGNTHTQDLMPTTLTSYKVSDTGERISMAAIRSAIEKACDDGNQIVNVSIGSLDESLLPVLGSSLTKGDEIFKKKLEEKGCLIVQAGGNDKSIDFQGIPLSKENSIIKIQAVSPVTGNRTNFSATSPFSAPGEDIFMPLSTQIPDLDPTPICSNAPGFVFENGTSFSTPLATKTLVMIRAVLSHSETFRSLPPSKQKELLASVLRESSSATGMISSIRAVKLAESVRKLLTNNSADSAVQSARRQLEQSECRSSKTPCEATKIANCAQANSCLNQLREHILTCPESSSARDSYVSIVLKQGSLSDLAVVGGAGHSTNINQKIIERIRQTNTPQQFETVISEAQSSYSSSAPSEVIDAIREKYRQLERDFISKGKWTPNEISTQLKISSLALQMRNGSAKVISEDEIFSAFEAGSEQKTRMQIYGKLLANKEQSVSPDLTAKLAALSARGSISSEQRALAMDVVEYHAAALSSEQFESYFAFHNKNTLTPPELTSLANGLMNSDLNPERKTTLSKTFLAKTDLSPENTYVIFNHWGADYMSPPQKRNTFRTDDDLTEIRSLLEKSKTIDEKRWTAAENLRKWLAERDQQRQH
jgi:subtilisin family serine protease